MEQFLKTESTLFGCKIQSVVYSCEIFQPNNVKSTILCLIPQVECKIWLVICNQQVKTLFFKSSETNRTLFIINYQPYGNYVIIVSIKHTLFYQMWFGIMIEQNRDLVSEKTIYVTLNISNNY